MTLPGRRHDRLMERIRDEVAEMIAAELKDPRIGFVTVTRVDLAADLHSARVLVSVMGDEDEQRQTLEGLNSATGYVRHELMKRLGLRRALEVAFLLDPGAEVSEKIETLLRELKREGEES